MHGVRAGAALLAAGLGTGLLVPAAAAAPAEDQVVCDRSVRDPGEAPAFQKPDDTLATTLRLADAHRISRGQGIGIAVVDSGVDATTGMVDVRGGSSVPGVGSGRPEDGHGTIVAGLAAGDSKERGVLGVAPDAHVVPIRVLDADASTSTEGKPLTGDNLAAGIRAATALRDSQQVRVINLSLTLDGMSRPVADAIDAAIAKEILVVAAVGNRPNVSAEGGEAEQYEVGEDAVRFPATHDGVLGVTGLDAAGDLDPSYVYTGPGTDVSAPAMHAMSVTVGGGTCLTGDPASSWATAEVSGLAALLFARDPSQTPAQVATRIMATARGAVNDSALDGHGMVQPLEALTAELDIARDGTLRQTPAYAAPRDEVSAPEPPRDISEESRRTMLWWGIGAGGALLLALLLRPLTAGRRG